jgi:hypothetical protein
VNLDETNNKRNSKFACVSSSSSSPSVSASIANGALWNSLIDIDLMKSETGKLDEEGMDEMDQKYKSLLQMKDGDARKSLVGPVMLST